MDGRKRPAGLRSRNNSPPNQRRRLNDRSFTSNRYANTAFPRASQSPPDSRKNSAAGLPANVSAGPARHSAHERYRDQHKPDGNRDVDGSKSGSSTPVQTAPTVPSMVPIIQRRAMSQSAPMDTLSALRRGKISYSSSSPQASDVVSAMEFKAVKGQLRVAMIETTRLRNQITQFEDRMKQLEGLPAQFAALQARVNNQDHAAAQEVFSDDNVRRLSAPEKAPFDSQNAELVQCSAKIDKLEADISDLAKDMCTKVDASQKACDEFNKCNLPGQLQTLQNTICVVTTDNEETRRTLTTLMGNVDNLRKSINYIEEDIGEYIGPIKEAYTTMGKTAILKRIENLEAIEHAQRPLIGQIRSFQSVQSKLSRTTSDLQTEYSTLQAGYNSLQPEHRSLRTDHDIANGQIKAIEREQGKLANECRPIAEQVDKFCTEQKNLADEQKWLQSEQARLSKEQKTLSNTYEGLDDQINGETGLVKIIDELQDVSESMEKDINNNTGNIALLRSSFVDLFSQHFDPFKAAVEQQLETHNTNISLQSMALAQLEEHVTERSTAPPASGLTAAQLTTLSSVVEDTITLKRTLERLQESVESEIEHRKNVVQNLKGQIASKQDTLIATKAIDLVKAGMRTLQNQYDNISTNDLHQSMVHWFLEQYPSSSATLVQQFTAVKQEVAQLHSFMDQIIWIPQYRQTLDSLAQLEPQLQALVHLNESFATIKDSMEEAQKQNEGLARTVKGLQTFMDALNTSNTPFADTEWVAALEQAVSKLQADVDARFTEEQRARDEFMAGKEHEDRVEAGTSIWRTVNDRFTELETGRIETAAEIENLQGDWTKDRTDLDRVLERFITPNEDFLIRLKALFEATCELQYYVECLNQNLPKEPLDIVWSYDLNSLPSATPMAESDESTGPARKGKRKQ